MDSDRELVEQAATGSASAVDALLARHLPGVRAYLRLRAGPQLLAKESASDLAQSVCRDVLENVDRFRYDGEDGFRRWLFKTAERKVLDRYAHWAAKKREATPEGLDATLSHYGDLHTPSRNAIAREELQRVEAAIDALPPAMREVFILAKVVGLSRRAIADELGKNEGAVRTTLHRALARVSDRLA